MGKLLYLVKLTRPDIAASVRELSKFMDRTMEEHWDAMRRVMTYVKGMSGTNCIYVPKRISVGH